MNNEPLNFEDQTKQDVVTLYDRTARHGNAIVELKQAILPAPVGELDELLLKDLIRQSVDIVSSIDAALIQNPAAADELRDARSAFKSARVYLELAVELDDTWKNKSKEEA